MHRRAEDAATDASPLADADPHAVVHADSASNADADDAHTDDCASDGHQAAHDGPAVAHADQPAVDPTNSAADRSAVAHADRTADQPAVDPADRAADRAAVAHAHARAEDARSDLDG